MGLLMRMCLWNKVEGRWKRSEGLYLCGEGVPSRTRECTSSVLVIPSCSTNSFVHEKLRSPSH
eukprot:scaffold32809_cov47-Cyclotella_meneghiniana.AAC.5